jgi:short-chain fatty acids transporter
MINSISRLGLRICDVFRRTAPDPFVLAVLLTLLTAAIALLLGFPAAGSTPRPELAERAGKLLDSWGGIERLASGAAKESATLGLWTLLGFAMQMCLVLVTGHALASSRPVRRVIDALAALPRTCAQAAAMVAFAACTTAVINWGLGLIVGALLAREVGRAMSRRGVPVHYPLLCAAGYTGLMVWHGGLSGSAPLSMTTRAGIEKVSPQLAAQLGENVMPLTETLFSTSNLIITLGLVVLVPAVCALFAPKAPGEMAPFREPVGDGRAEASGTETQPAQSDSRPGVIPEWLETSPLIVWFLAAAVFVVIWRYSAGAGLASLSLNHINGGMLALGLVFHGSARSYVGAVDEAARGCGGIVVQFPLYAGIMAMMQASGLVRMLADSFVAMSTPTTLPLFTFVSGGIVNLFVPSGGGQWAVQGPIAMQSGMEAGVPLGKMVMSVAYGDQLTNMLQPFWALPLLAITGVKAREIVGYTALIMLAGAAWIALWLLVL